MSLTTDLSHPDLPRGVDNTPVDQAKVYCVLDEKEIAKGYIRPFRKTYWHEICGKPTTMADQIAATYATDPWFYGGAYCANCRMHRDHEEFYWEDPRSQLVLGGVVDKSMFVGSYSLDPLKWSAQVSADVLVAVGERSKAREAAGKPPAVGTAPAKYWKAVEPPPRKPYPNHVRLTTSGNAILVSYSDGQMQEVRIPPLNT